jgi:ferredoxin
MEDRGGRHVLHGQRGAFLHRVLSTRTRCGKCVRVRPTGALFDESKIGSDQPKYPDFLPYLNMMREAQ